MVTQIKKGVRAVKNIKLIVFAFVLALFDIGWVMSKQEAGPGEPQSNVAVVYEIYNKCSKAYTAATFDKNRQNPFPGELFSKNIPELVAKIKHLQSISKVWGLKSFYNESGKYEEFPSEDKEKCLLCLYWLTQAVCHLAIENGLEIDKTSGDIKGFKQTGAAAVPTEEAVTFNDAQSEISGFIKKSEAYIDILDAVGDYFRAVSEINAFHKKQSVFQNIFDYVKSKEVSTITFASLFPSNCSFKFDLTTLNKLSILWPFSSPYIFLDKSENLAAKLNKALTDSAEKYIYRLDKDLSFALKTFKCQIGFAKSANAPAIGSLGEVASLGTAVTPEPEVPVLEQIKNGKVVTPPQNLYKIKSWLMQYLSFEQTYKFGETEKDLPVNLFKNLFILATAYFDVAEKNLQNELSLSENLFACGLALMNVIEAAALVYKIDAKCDYSGLYSGGSSFEKNETKNKVDKFYADLFKKDGYWNYFKKFSVSRLSKIEQDTPRRHLYNGFYDCFDQVLLSLREDLECQKNAPHSPGSGSAVRSFLATKIKLGWNRFQTLISKIKSSEKLSRFSGWLSRWPGKSVKSGEGIELQEMGTPPATASTPVTTTAPTAETTATPVATTTPVIETAAQTTATPSTSEVKPAEAATTAVNPFEEKLEESEATKEEIKEAIKFGIAANPEGASELLKKIKSKERFEFGNYSFNYASNSWHLIDTNKKKDISPTFSSEELEVLFSSTKKEK